MTNKHHGGKRLGSGRKTVNPNEPTKVVTIRFPLSQYEWLTRQSANVSEFIRDLVTKEQTNEQDIHTE